VVELPLLDCCVVGSGVCTDIADKDDEEGFSIIPFAIHVSFPSVVQLEIYLENEPNGM